MRPISDLSDGSFQIPSPHEDRLLNADEPCLELAYDVFDDQELGGLDDDPFTTPLVKSKHHAPLTLSEITPRGESREHGTLGNGEGSNSNVAAEKKHGDFIVRNVPPRKEPVNDMFARRKRDSYQQMGIDLTSKSTARHRRPVGEVVRTTEAHASGMKSPGPAKHSAKPRAGRNHIIAKTKRPILGEDVGIKKHKPCSARQIRPKSILKHSKPVPALPSSTLARTMTNLSQTPKSERPKWGDVVAEVHRTSRDRNSRNSGIMGGGLIDVLVMYGEKLKGSLGFSLSGNAPTNPPNNAPAPPTDGSYQVTPDLGEDLSCHPQDMANQPLKPLTLADLTPSKSHAQRRNNPLTLSELSPSRQPLELSEGHEESGVVGEAHLRTSPMRPSKKRTITRSPRGERKRKKNQEPAERPESSKIAGGRAPPVVKPAPKSRALGPSHIANGVPKNTKPLPAKPRTSPVSDIAAQGKPRPATVSSHDPKGKRAEAPSVSPHSERIVDEDHHAPTSLTSLPSGPVFASDVYRHRALEKAQVEREKKEEKEKQKRSFKAGAMPYFHKPAPPARPAVRKTVPVAFTFQSDARAAQRNSEFEEKRKTWESRATRHALPMPNFVAIHAAQAETVRARRAAPVLPTAAPALTTMIRAKDREKFEEERRAREKATERLREMREKERAEQDERAYKEARKLTVPKANEVPEWYKTVPKRREID